MKCISVRLTDEMIEKISKFTGRSQSEVVRDAIVKEIEDLEQSVYPLNLKQRCISDMTFSINGEVIEVVDYSIIKEGQDNIMKIITPYNYKHKELSKVHMIQMVDGEIKLEFHGAVSKVTEFVSEEKIFIQREIKW